jgi:hypothetical protein
MHEVHPAFAECLSKAGSHTRRSATRSKFSGIANVDAQNGVRAVANRLNVRILTRLAMVSEQIGPLLRFRGSAP